MYTIENTINESAFKGLKATKLRSIDAKEIKLITIEKNHELPAHSSPRDANLIVLEGVLDFYIENKSFRLEKQQVFGFGKNVIHSAKAIENTKFLIIR